MQRALAAIALALWLVLAPGPAGAATDAGEALYRQGLVRGAAPLVATGAGGQSLRGTAAACVNCHQRSGLGSREGRIVVPPITGRYLYRPRPRPGADDPVPYVEGMRSDRDPYDTATLARAIRQGVDVQGRVLSDLMPRYALSDADLGALADYLKRLDSRRVLGVTASMLHFATVITPDADPTKRAGMLDVMNHLFADHNARQMNPVPAMRTSGRTAYAKSMFLVSRRWQLHVWDLTGPPSTWQAQLDRHLADEPVLAVVSGLGGATWEPVHAFCERAALPCIFPNVDAPPTGADGDFYSVYFSRGVMLEAELVARRLGEQASAGHRVVQVYRTGDVGEAAATAFDAAAAAQHLKIVRRPIDPGAPAAAVAQVVEVAAADADTMLLWLRPADIESLPAAPPQGPALYLSGRMGGLERSPLPRAWRASTRVAYPFELPDRRRVRVDFALGWMSAHHIRLVDEQVQADTYLACGLVAETLQHMSDVFVRDYLIEQLQSMIGRRIVTGYYPRLSLATGQRFASKGGRIVHFVRDEGVQLAPDTEWTIP